MRRGRTGRSRIRRGHQRYEKVVESKGNIWWKSLMVFIGFVLIVSFMITIQLGMINFFFFLLFFFVSLVFFEDVRDLSKCIESRKVYWRKIK